MSQLLVRNLSEAIVRKLKLQAAHNGVSTEEEHRRILEAALGGPARPVSYTAALERGWVGEESMLREEVLPYGSGLPAQVTAAATGDQGLSFKAHLMALGDLGVEDVDFERPRKHSRRRNQEI